MPDQNLERPKFLDSFLGAIQKSAEKRSWRAVIPIWLLVAGCFGAVFAYLIPAHFWSKDKLEAAAAVYIGIITLNGLILALSWSAFSRIHERIIDSHFCAYLMNKGLLGDYIFYIDFVHVAQLSSIVISGGGLLILLCEPENITFDRIAFGAMIFISSYAIKQAAAAVTVMHDLIWQKAIFDDHMQSRRRDSAIEIRKEDARTTLQSRYCVRTSTYWRAPRRYFQSCRLYAAACFADVRACATGQPLLSTGGNFIHGAAPALGMVRLRSLPLRIAMCRPETVHG